MVCCSFLLSVNPILEASASRQLRRILCYVPYSTYLVAYEYLGTLFIESDGHMISDWSRRRSFLFIFHSPTIYFQRSFHQPLFLPPSNHGSGGKGQVSRRMFRLSMALSNYGRNRSLVHKIGDPCVLSGMSCDLGNVRHAGVFVTPAKPLPAHKFFSQKYLLLLSFRSSLS